MLRVVIQFEPATGAVTGFGLPPGMRLADLVLVLERAKLQVLSAPPKEPPISVPTQDQARELLAAR